MLLLIKYYYTYDSMIMYADNILIARGSNTRHIFFYRPLSDAGAKALIWGCPRS